MKTYPSQRAVKRKVKQIKKEQSVSIANAYEIFSRNENRTSWRVYKKELDKYWAAEQPIPDVSNSFVNDHDVHLSNEDYRALDKERTKQPSTDEKSVLKRNREQLTRLGIEYSIFEPTITGLKKSILDATQSVRTHFELENFHIYSAQEQGPDSKVVKSAFLLTEDKIIKSRASLYRPKTKMGDPRMWFRSLAEISHPGELVCIIILDDDAYLINLLRNDLSLLINGNNHISTILRQYSTKTQSHSDILLSKLKEIAKYPVVAQKVGDTAVGHALESILGIEANSSKQPDYNGIEIKSGRGGKNRNTIFAQVADWSISPCRKSAEILDKYGYQREDDMKLYCTVSTQRMNTQGLHFKYNKKNDSLEEWYKERELVAVWPGVLLRSRLAEKHKETFWIEADTSKSDKGDELFYYKSVIHTRKPILSQLMPLIESGVITMDHLIKRSGKTGRVSEKGPLFKIDKKNLSLLFPEPRNYNLLD